MPMLPNAVGPRLLGNQQGPRAEKSDGLSSSLRMQLLMAELERERQAIAHDKKRNAMMLETQEKFIYEAKSDLMKFHAMHDNPVWSVPAKVRSFTPEVEEESLNSSESKLEANASFTTFTDLTQITTDGLAGSSKAQCFAMI